MKGMNGRKSIGAILVIAAFLIVVFGLWFGLEKNNKNSVIYKLEPLTFQFYDKFEEAVVNGEVDTAQIGEVRIEGRLKNRRPYTAPNFSGSGVVDLLKKHNVRIGYGLSPPLLEEIRASREKEGGSWIGWIIWLVIFALSAILFIYFFRALAGGFRSSGGPFQAGKSWQVFRKGQKQIAGAKSAQITTERPKETFANVAGLVTTKEELKEIVDFLKDTKRFKKFGAKIPRGALLVGPPGTGKTLLARAVAGEADASFIPVAGSEFVEMFVGVGASRIRDLFKQALANVPCIIFIDELDAVGKSRSSAPWSNDERESTLNQLLTEMDGFDQHSGVIILAATNKRDSLDHALIRKGRFDREIVVPRPDQKERIEILNLHIRLNNVPVDGSVDEHYIRSLARHTQGRTGADLANLVNEAALIAARHKEREPATVTCYDFEAALSRVMLGIEHERKGPAREELIKAAHEAGHALAGYRRWQKDPANADPVNNVSIISRGMSGGVTVFLPEDEYNIPTQAYIINRIIAGCGGRAGELVKFGKSGVSIGALHDIDECTRLLTNLVYKAGLAFPKIMVAFGKEKIIIGEDSGGPLRNFDEETRRKLSNTLIQVAAECFATAESIIRVDSEKFEELIKKLMEKQQLKEKDIQDIFGEAPSEDFWKNVEASAIPLAKEIFNDFISNKPFLFDGNSLAPSA